MNKCPNCGHPLGLDEFLADAAQLWNAGHDTAEIASRLGYRESTVYNRLEAIRLTATLTRPDAGNDAGAGFANTLEIPRNRRSAKSAPFPPQNAGTLAGGQLTGVALPPLSEINDTHALNSSTNSVSQMEFVRSEFANAKNSFAGEARERG